MKTGIVIVTWNSAEVIGQCLDACLRFSNVEVVVVDNASEDNTVTEVRKRPEVRLFANTTNLGFAGGVNQGVSALDHEAVLLLNPDAMPVKGLEELTEAVLREGIGAAGGRLTDATGRTQSGFNVRAFPHPLSLAFEVTGINRLLPGNRWNKSWRTTPPEDRVTDVDQPAGAFLMLNRSAWKRVEGFDEGFYPVWFEDVDFCLRLKETGYRILYVPFAEARHIGGHSAARLTWENRQLFWYGSLLRFSAKHFTVSFRRVVSIAVMLASGPRALLGVLSGRSLKAVAIYHEVFRMALTAAVSATLPRLSDASSGEGKRARQFHS